MKLRNRIIVTLLWMVQVTGYGSAEHDHDHDGHGHEDGTLGSVPAHASYREGHGLRLDKDTLAALGVKTVVAEERIITPEYGIDAQVFEQGPPLRAVAFVPPEVAEAVGRHTQAGLKIVSIRRELDSAVGRAEIILELAEALWPAPAAKLQLRGVPRPCLAIPRDAVLRSATGACVYVVNGDDFLRTMVRTGAESGEWIEIIEGLHPGDGVAASGVEQLWLTELRLTKGGGHSH